MPELPEVETIRRGLEPRIVGLTIRTVEIHETKTAQFDASALETLVLGQAVTAVRRRAKVLIWDLASGYSLLFHLKMTGQIIIDSTEGERFAGGHPTKSMDRATTLPDKSTRLVFVFDEGKVVYFNDQRKFGWVKLIETKHLLSESLLAKVGPEPHGEDFKFEAFYEALSRRKAPIKGVLLDQTVVAGVGNIYADESLHLAKIHPATRASTIKKPQATALFEAIKLVLHQSIEQGGTSFTNYVNVLGTRGDYLETARVFKKEGLACAVCGDTIIKTRVAGRGTHICPTCQPAPKRK